MNKVLLTGNLCKDIELRQTNTGKSVTSNTIAVKRDIKDTNGDYQTDFIDIVVWGAAADYLEKYASKGDRAEVVGRWQNRTYQTNEGINRTINEVQVENINVIPKANKAQDNASERNNTNTYELNDDLPF